MQKCTTGKKIRIVILAVEVLLIINILISFMQPRVSNTFFVEDMESKGAIEVELEGKGWYVDNSITLNQSIFLQTKPMNLPQGVYKIIVHHQTEGDGTRVNFSSDKVTYRLIAGRQDMKLNSGYATTEYEIHLTEGQEAFKVEFQFAEDGYAWIASVDVMQLWNMERVNAFYTVVVICITELLFVFMKRDTFSNLLKKREGIKAIIAGLLVSIPIAISILPCFSYYVIEGFDLNFHLMRIEGIAESLKSGCFPARIQTNWLKGYGYPVSVFYGDLLLYFPAVLRVIGLSLQDAYKWYLCSINVLTAITIYLSAKGMTRSRKVSVVVSYLYLLLPYRLSCIYTRSGVGEYSAMAFFPLIIWGLYRIYTKDEKGDKRKCLWIIPTIGFTGVIESHLLSTVFVGIFTVICCLILFKKTFQKNCFIELLKVVLATVAANVMYLVPLLDFMQNKYKVADNAQGANIQTQGGFLSQIFSLIPNGQGISLSVTENLMSPNEITVSLGATAWIGIILFGLYALLRARRRVLSQEDRTEGDVVYLLMGMAMVTVYISTVAFPWDAIADRLGAIGTIFTSIEFPWRYLSISSVFFVLGIAFVLNSDLLNNELPNIMLFDKKYVDVIYIIIICCAIVPGAYFISDEIENGQYSYLVAACDLDDSKLMGSEYIPQGVDEGRLLKLSNPEAKEVVIEHYSLDTRDCVLTLNYSGHNAEVSVPRIYYDGYEVQLEGADGWISCYSDDIGRVCFDVPQEYVGQAIVRFREPWYWRGAEVVSIVTLMLMTCLVIVKRDYI